MDRVCVGVVVGVHGVTGTVKIKSFTEEPADVGAYGPVEDEAGQRRRLKVIGTAKGVVLGRLDGVSDRNAAEALKGLKLFVPRKRLPPPQEDEFYLSDLIGLQAEQGDGTVLGTVKAVFDFGAGDVLEIGRPDGGTDLLPFSKAVVPTIDLAGGRMVIVPPEEVEVRPGGPAEGEGEADG